MASFQAGYLAVMALSLVTSAAVGVLAWRRRPTRGAAALTAFTGGIFVWLLGTAGSVVATEYGRTVALGKLSYLGIVVVSPAFLVLAMEYTGRGEWVDRRLLAALAVEPAVVLGALLVAPELIWPSVSVADTPIGIVADHGPLFWIHASYSYALLAAGTALLVAFLYRSRYLYTLQVLALLVAIGAPWGANLVYLSGIVDVDPTPVGFAVTGVALGWALLRADLVELAPVARDAVVEHVNRGVFVVDEAERLVDINPAGREMLDVDGDVVGMPLRDAVGGSPEFVAEFEDVAEKREEVVVDTPDGPRVLDVEVTALTDYRDRRQGRLFIVGDVTERRRSQRELERRNEQLDKFASVVSHDLRNPLNVVGGYLEHARETGDTDVLANAEGSVERMNHLIDDVLSLAREGRRIETPESVSLRAVAEAAWGNVETGEATLSVGADPTVPADRSRLLQAFENLFRNAVEHAGPAVTVEVGLLDDGRGFYVQDDGPGIPATERADVFEHGYTGSPDGTGLGLSIVASVADAHGWSLTLADGTDGARFEFADVGVEAGRDGGQRSVLASRDAPDDV